jgi:hypothetical protein
VINDRWENKEILPYGATIAGQVQNVLRVLELHYKALMGSAIVPTI